MSYLKSLSDREIKKTVTPKTGSSRERANGFIFDVRYLRDWLYSKMLRYLKICMFMAKNGISKTIENCDFLSKSCFCLFKDENKTRGPLVLYRSKILNLIELD